MKRRTALKNTGLWAGALLSAPILVSLLEACNQEPRMNWKPQFFSEPEAKTISTMVDMILPRTTTPGALDVKVDIFIDKVIAQTYDTDAQRHIRDQLREFNTTCETEYGSHFVDLDHSERLEVLRKHEKSSGKFSRGVWGQPVGPQEPIGFYRSMKSMAIWAYFTAEEVGEQVLNYDPIPGDYKGCISLSEIGNRWSL